MDNLLDLARPRIEVLLEERRTTLIRETEVVKSEASLRGVLHSGAVVQQLTDQCIKEIRECDEEIWKILKEVAERLGAPRTDDLGRVLKGEVSSVAGAQKQALTTFLEKELKQLMLGSREQLLEHARQELLAASERAIRRTTAEIDLFVSSEPEKEVARKESKPNPNMVFLSHAASDREFGMTLKTEFERRLPGVQVFCSSDPTDLPPGSTWSAEIQKALTESGTLLILATRRGLSRPWVWFETGTFWFSGKPVIPLCVGAVRKNDLPAPLRDRQALNLDDPEDVRILLEDLAKRAGLAIDLSELRDLAEKLSRLEASAEPRADLWMGAEWNGHFLTFEGPVEGLRPIEDEVFQQSMSDALERAGYRPRLGQPFRLSDHLEKGYRVIHLTDRTSWRRRISKGDAVLIARLKEA